MKIRFNGSMTVLALAAAMIAPGASAQAAGEWIAKVGINKVTSEDASAPALPGSKADVGSDTQPIITLGRMLTDNISLELDLGLPYTHKMYGAGVLEGTGQLRTAEVLPPTAFIQYHFFKPDAMVRPYVGLGLTYSYFRKETGSPQLSAILHPGQPGTYSMKNKWAGNLQVGASVAINTKWFVDLNVVKSKLKTTATFSNGQTQGVRLDPLAAALTLGYRF